MSRILLARCAFRSCTALCFLAAAIVRDLHDEVFDNGVVRVSLIGLVDYEACLVYRDATMGVLLNLVFKHSSEQRRFFNSKVVLRMKPAATMQRNK